MYLCTETKAQISCAVTAMLISLRSYRAADLDLCFHVMQNSGFHMTQLSKSSQSSHLIIISTENWTNAFQIRCF